MKDKQKLARLSLCGLNVQEKLDFNGR